MKTLLQSIFSIAVTFVLASVGYSAEQKAMLAGGCFWGVEAVFEHVKGVKDVRSGYTGGTKETANYDEVSNGSTKHAEAVEITFDDKVITFDQLLYIFFAVVHDPTEVDRQGPDVGPQYRSAIFYFDDKQKRSGEAFVLSINTSKVFDKPVATQISKFEMFYTAEQYHQDYLKKNPENPYIVQHDMPKLAELKKKFPELWQDRYGLVK